MTDDIDTTENATRLEPPPKPSSGREVWPLVIADLRTLGVDASLIADAQARDTWGRAKYGTPLQAHNGRDALVDAYQEALDLAVYLRQRLEEGDPVVSLYSGALALLREVHARVRSSASSPDPALVVGMDSPWPVFEVLRHLERATGYLLDDYGYDRIGWETIEHARRAALEHLKTAGVDPLPSPFVATDPVADLEMFVAALANGSALEHVDPDLRELAEAVSRRVKDRPADPGWIERLAAHLAEAPSDRREITRAG